MDTPPAKPSLKPDLEEKTFKSQKDFEAWLHKNHDKSPGIWLKMAKKASGIPTVVYKEAVDVVLCYGWIDGQSKSIDETWYRQRFVPRRPKSIWSQINRDNIARLTAAGKMQPSGIAAVDAAKKDGRWDAAYASPSKSVAPPELVAALAKNPKAKQFYEALNKTNTYAIIWRIETAKKPETRLARIENVIAMLERGEKFH